jgi:hypothetical protein
MVEGQLQAILENCGAGVKQGGVNGGVKKLRSREVEELRIFDLDPCSTPTP